MQEFNGMQYLAIDLANTFGLDKETWDNRITWVKDHINVLEDKIEEADEHLLFTKAVNAFRKAQKGEPINHIMALDATASGIQVMSVMSGCKITAEAVNLVDPTERKDIYLRVSQEMSGLLGRGIERSVIKKPLMTMFYGSRLKPVEVFGDGTPELKAFLNGVYQACPGACDVMEILRDSWRSDVTEVSFRMPDGHCVYLPVIEKERHVIETDGGLSFIYDMKVNKPSSNGTSIIANSVHSVDAYIVREMVRRANKQGFYLSHIHDAFVAHPNHMNNVRRNYINILAELADSNLLESIVSQITGKKVKIQKDSNDLSKYIRQANYPLS